MLNLVFMILEIWQNVSSVVSAEVPVVCSIASSFDILQSIWPVFGLVGHIFAAFSCTALLLYSLVVAVQAFQLTSKWFQG